MLVNRCLSIVLSALLAFPATFWSGVASAIVSSDVDVALAEKLARSERFAGELRQAINRSAFDLEALLEKLEFDHENIIRFVRDEIAFEQYHGALRGPKGTLMSQAGNSLDQSVLLAKLLRDAGYDARVARGTLDEADARTLLRQMSRPRPAVADLGDVAKGVAVMKQIGFMTSLDDSQTQKLVDALERPPVIGTTSGFEAFQFTTAQLQEAYDSLAANTVSELDAAVLNEARDYFWVETKLGAADAWQDIHPVLPEGVNVKPGRVATLADEVPQELLHRIRLQMFIERSAGGQSSTVAVMDAWERPVANLVGVPVVFAALPDSALDPANVAMPPQEIIARANYFVPSLLSGPAPGAQFFDLAGNTIDPMAASNIASGVVKQVGEAFGEATGAIGDESSVPRLEAVWIEITLIAPSGKETVYRRTLTGAAGTVVGTGTDSRLASVLPLLRSNTLVVAAGRTPRGTAIDEQLIQWQSIVPGIKALAWGVEGNTTLSPEDRSALPEVPRHWHGHLAMLSRFDVVEDWSDKHRLYRHEPFVAIHTAGVSDSGGSMARVDVVHNARRAFDISGAEARFDPRAQIAGGVWETVSEGSMLESGDRTGAMRVLQAARDQKIALRSIKPGDALVNLPVEGDAVRHLKADLERGYAVLIPEARPEGYQQTAWWRLDPRTGETLGMLDDGRGVELTERAIIMIGVAGVVFLHYSLYGCFSQAYGARGSDVNFQLLCCVMVNYGSMLAMTITSAFVGLKVSETAADLMGFGVDVADFNLGFDGFVCDVLLN